MRRRRRYPKAKRLPVYAYHLKTLRMSETATKLKGVWRATKGQTLIQVAFGEVVRVVHVP